VFQGDIMPQIGLSTFAKIIQMTPEKKIVEYSRYLKPGGFDFYRELREAISVATWKEGDVAKAFSHIATIADVSRRKHSTTAFEAFVKEFIVPGNIFHQPPTSEITSPSKFITVRIRPSALIQCGSEFQLVTIWPNSTTKLHPRGAGAIVDLMSKFLITNNPITRYIVADLAASQPMMATKTSVVASAMVASELAFADSFFSAEVLKQKAA
jgi:hypothetical protein